MGNGHGDMSSNPERDWLQFTLLNTLGKATSLGEGKLWIPTC